MIKLIMEKELREMLSSKKFILTFLVSSILIILAFYVGAENHLLNMRRYEASKAENFRKMEGLTDWMKVNDHRVFLEPQPLEALVTGVSNDIGRTMEISGRGDLTAYDSRYGEDPVFAVFRFLDLEFIFKIVLSLFAILFAYNAINGEKERGTLRLSFANPVSRVSYILGKILGSLSSLVIPLLIPILFGMLIIIMKGITLTSDEWVRLGFIILTGLLYFSAFLTMSIFVSTLTHKSSNSFLIMLVIWIFVVFIIPRTAVLLAGRSVNVPTIDEISFQKAKLLSQLWKEDREKLSSFKPQDNSDMEAMATEFSQFMQQLSDDREKEMQKLSSRLNEERENRQTQQQKFAFGLSRISPAASFSLATTNLAGSSLNQKKYFKDIANAYQETFGKFMLEKTGMNMGSGVMMMTIGQDDEEPKPIDPHKIPPFIYQSPSLAGILNGALMDMAILVLFNIIFFSGAFVSFLRYDVR